MSAIKKVLKKYQFLKPAPNVSVTVQSLPGSELLKGRCALITGGTSGIGYSIAQAYIKAGASVIITGRNQEKLDNALASLNSLKKDGAYGFFLDNTNVGSFDLVFKEMQSVILMNGIPYIDILVNNAGVNYRGMPNAIEDEYDKVLDTNLKGVFFLSQMFGKYLIKKHIKGNILNIASASSLRPADSAYTIAKWGIRGLTLGLAKSLAKNGITVNGIAPGPTATPMMKISNDCNMYHPNIPLGRFITPEEISNMAVFLVSEMGRSIMGDIVYMTGGAGILTLDDVPYGFDL